MFFLFFGLWNIRVIPDISRASSGACLRAYAQAGSCAKGKRCIYLSRHSNSFQVVLKRIIAIGIGIEIVLCAFSGLRRDF